MRPRPITILLVAPIIAALILWAAASVLTCAGCYWPPADPDARANAGPTTRPADDPAEKTADAIDSTVAVLLSLLGPAGAIGGVLWGRLRPARTIKRLVEAATKAEAQTENLVASVQAGRARLKAHAKVALVDFDDTVRAVQDAATAEMVRTIKHAAHLRSVTHGDPPPATPARPEKPDPMDTD